MRRESLLFEYFPSIWKYVISKLTDCRLQADGTVHGPGGGGGGGGGVVASPIFPAQQPAQRSSQGHMIAHSKVGSNSG